MIIGMRVSEILKLRNIAAGTYVFVFRNETFPSKYCGRNWRFSQHSKLS